MMGKELWWTAKKCENEETKVSPHLFKEISGIILTTLCLMVALKFNVFTTIQTFVFWMNERRPQRIENLQYHSFPFFSLSISFLSYKTQYFLTTNRYWGRMIQLMKSRSFFMRIFSLIQVSRSKLFGFLCNTFSPRKNHLNKRHWAWK